MAWAGLIPVVLYISAPGSFRATPCFNRLTCRQLTPIRSEAVETVASSQDGLEEAYLTIHGLRDECEEESSQEPYPEQSFVIQFFRTF